MNKTELITIISKDENERVEFKNSFQKKVIISGNYSSKPRNKQIASIFKEANVIEKYGSGIKRIIEGFENYRLPKPKFRANTSDFYVTVFLNVPEEETFLSGGVNDVLNFIKNNPDRRTVEISEKLLISKRTVDIYIKQLKENNNIEFRGAPKTSGYWVAISKNK